MLRAYDVISRSKHRREMREVAMLAEMVQMPRAEPPTELQQFLLDRLDRLVALGAEGGQGFDVVHLLRWAIYSTYADCRDLGAAAPARAILARLPAPSLS